MINTLLNAYSNIPLVVKAPYCTCVIHALTTRNILPYMFDNSILLMTQFHRSQFWLLKSASTFQYSNLIGCIDAIGMQILMSL